MDLGLAGKVALVTGASRGIGLSTAAELAGEGCRLVICARGEEALRAAEGELKARGAAVVAVTADLADAAAPARLVEAAAEAFGGVDILVNNAGGGVPARPLALTPADWKGGFDVDFFGAARLSQACLPGMRARRWGRIVNIASIYGIEPDPWFAPYSAAKAALINLTQTLALAYSADGVLINCVVPGVIMTEMVAANARSAADATATSVEAVMDQMMERHPVATGRFGQPREVAAAVAFLASERASWITGACLAVDGGTLRSIR